MTTPITGEFRGPEFEIEWHRTMMAWCIAGKPENSNPEQLWEYLRFDDDSWQTNKSPCCPSFSVVIRYRWKPTLKRMVTIGYVDKYGHWEPKTLVAPEVEALEFGTNFYIPFANGVYKSRWANSYIDKTLLAHSAVFLTREDAQAMSDWLTECRNGGVK